MGTLTVKVIGKTEEADDICSFELSSIEGRLLPAFSAGSHIDVKIPDGTIRQYSLCNHPAERHRYLIGVLREPESRGGSKTLHDRVQVGDRLEISEPRNHFALQSAKRFLLFAGGIGITPILSMAERLCELDGVEFELHYNGRTARRMAFVERIKSSSFAARARFHFDDGDPQQRLDVAAVLANPAPDCHLYVCGPSGYMDWIINAAKNAQWPDEKIHREYFSAEAVDSSGDQPFEVQIAGTGQVVQVQAGQRVTDVLSAAGIDVSVSCQEGVCGACLTRVLEGEILHRDLYLTEQEREANDQFMPCVSRSRSRRLVLDL